MSYLSHKLCRACSSDKLVPVFDLGNQPLANDHCLPGEARQGFYPLCVLFCEKCGLSQLSVVVNRDQIYRRYSYVSSASVTMLRHYDRLFKDITSEVPAFNTLVEIASNEGGCLAFAKTIGFGFRVLGIDPAVNLANMANARGIETIPEFFNEASAIDARTRIGEPGVGVILARHVFAHVDDWREFFKAVELLASKDTLIVLEFPYVLDLLAKGTWDTIYHEHLSVISLRPIVELLRWTPFHIHRITKVGVHGGALVMMLRHNDHAAIPHLSADEMLADERVTVADWQAFAAESRRRITRLTEMVMDLRAKGKIVSIFGASAKSTVLCAACGFDVEDIAFCTDNSPFKPGKLVPGTSIPIIEESEMLSQHPDVAICGAWNYRGEILDKMSKYRSRGGKFVFPTDDGWEVV